MFIVDRVEAERTVQAKSVTKEMGGQVLGMRFRETSRSWLVNVP